jgi:HSP20 family protein
MLLWVCNAISLVKEFFTRRTRPLPEFIDGGTPMAKNPNDSISFPLHLSREVERLFDEIIHRPWGVCREIRGWNPSLDVYETDKEFIVEVDLPGVTSGEVQTEIVESDLVVRGARSLEKRYTEGQFHTMERSSGHFVRHIHLPEPVDKDGVKGECHDGVLRVVVPKAKQLKLKDEN